MQEHFISSPLRVRVSKKKWFVLNLNQYRNMHFRALNAAKIEYKKKVKEQIRQLPAFNKVHVHYTVYPKDKRLFDLGNVTSIHQKFFEDALVELNKLTDDSYIYISTTSHSFGKICKEDPRVLITITPKT